MIAPKTICNPPNPKPSHTSFQGTDAAELNHAEGGNMAIAPNPRKHAPITGTMGTENAPPVITPVPYSISQTPGIAATTPARHKTTVSAAPTTRGGTQLKTNFRVAGAHIGSPAALALCRIARTPSATANTPSASHTASQASTE